MPFRKGNFMIFRSGIRYVKGSIFLYRNPISIVGREIGVEITFYNKEKK